jgi:hypothetical protein
MCSKPARNSHCTAMQCMHGATLVDHVLLTELALLADPNRAEGARATRVYSIKSRASMLAGRHRKMARVGDDSGAGLNRCNETTSNVWRGELHLPD